MKNIYFFNHFIKYYTPYEQLMLSLIKTLDNLKCPDCNSIVKYSYYGSAVSKIVYHCYCNNLCLRINLLSYKFLNYNIDFNYNKNIITIYNNNHIITNNKFQLDDKSIHDYIDFINNKKYLHFINII